MSDAVISLSYIESDIVVLTFDDKHKGANVLSRSVLDELSSHLDALEKREDLAGLILCSGKPGTFIAGADLREFAQAFGMPAEKTLELCTHGRRLFQRLSLCPFVTVAAIDGICVGGGAEMASWCDHRIMSDGPRTQFGFPEVKLGLFPGWGGTATATRLVGLANAVEMVTSGESISAQDALAMGWAWDAVTSQKLMDAAVRLIRYENKSNKYIQSRGQRSQGVMITETELSFLGATASAYIQGKTKGHYPAPLAALELMLGAAGLEIEPACQMEAEGMAKLFGTPVNRALINVFFLTDRNKKDKGVTGDVSHREINSVAVVGAGIMGQGITASCVKRDIPVAISDVNREALAAGVSGILEEVAYDKQTKRTDADRMARYAPLVNGTTSIDELAAADLVIEAVIEKTDVKKSLFAQIEPKLSEAAILATNTSTIPIKTLADGLAQPHRFVGIHFFNPVRSMPLVEVIRGPKSSDETVASAVAFAKRIKKSPVVVNDGPGFLVNRLLMPYMHESLELLLDGVPVETIEKTAKRFGMPMGPITLYDVVGLDTALYAGGVLCEAFPERFQSSPLLQALVKAGRLGQKSGSGFYAYVPKKKKGLPDPKFAEILKPLVRDKKPLVRDEIEARLFMPMFLEATRAMEEGIARDVRDVDLALIFGIGFPPFKGGLFFWADTIGAKKILETVESLKDLGPRMAPTKLLSEVAASGGRFYDWNRSN